MQKCEQTVDVGIPRADVPGEPQVRGCTVRERIVACVLRYPAPGGSQIRISPKTIWRREGITYRRQEFELDCLLGPTFRQREITDRNEIGAIRQPIQLGVWLISLQDLKLVLQRGHAQPKLAGGTV